MSLFKARQYTSKIDSVNYRQTGSITYKTYKHLATVLSPLVGRTENFVKNSTQLGKKTEELEVPLEAQ